MVAHRWSKKNAQQSKQTHIIIMDFAKAFDRVSHNLLFHKSLPVADHKEEKYPQPQLCAV